MMAVNVYRACIVGIFTTRLRRLFVCGPRCAKNNSSCAAFRCAMARERDRAPQIRTTDANSAPEKVYAQGVLAKIEYIKICSVFFCIFCLIEKRRGLSPGGRFPPSFIHQVIIITGLNKLQLYVLALKMALDADRA